MQVAFVQAGGGNAQRRYDLVRFVFCSRAVGKAGMRLKTYSHVPLFAPSNTFERKFEMSAIY